MKFINLFLLVLIITGLVAFATQSMWVPKLVASIIASESEPPLLVQASQGNIPLENGKQCFSYSHEATTAEPYAVRDFLVIEIDGDAVAGKKTGTQNGPGMSNGYEGFLMGTLDKNTITAILSYTVEGSQGKEKEIYKAGKKGLEKQRYQLIEEGGVLVPDMTKSFTILNYDKVECEALN